LQKGAIKKAYQGLMHYIMDLRTYFKSKYPDHFVPGNIYYGYMDMTYFSFFPWSLKIRGLKIGIVFIHETCSFEIWLFGYNKEIQSKYWNLFKEAGWNKYRLVATTKGADSILEHPIDHADFSDLSGLTRCIETAAMQFTEDIESFLTRHEMGQ
jgi:hypothetical protein